MQLARPPSIVKRGCRRAVRVSARAAAAPPRPSATAATNDSKRGEQLQSLLAETVRIVTSTGPKGLIRGLQAAEAVASLGREYLLQRGGRLDEPPVILRRLFEKLGATYIKLGA